MSTTTVPHMQAGEEGRFHQVLAELEVLFEHALSPQKRGQYWQLLCHSITLEEWEYAAQEAMRRETFFKVPLPGHLMDYVREYRTHGLVL